MRLSDNALTDFGRFVHAVAVSSEVDVLAWAGRQDAAALIAESRGIVVSEGAAITAQYDDPATVAFRATLLDELHKRALAEDAERADAEDSKPTQTCATDGHEHRPAIAVLVYSGQLVNIAHGEWLGVCLCRECVTCSGDCDALGDVIEAVSWAPWCQHHADAWGPERVTGPDLVPLDSDRYRALIAEHAEREAGVARLAAYRWLPRRAQDELYARARGDEKSASVASTSRPASGDPAGIARQLTPAMRDTITRDEDTHGNVPAENPSTVGALVKLGLALRSGGVWFKRTDLGRAVRDANTATTDIMSFALGTKVTWRAPSMEDGSNEIGIVLEDGRPFVLMQFPADDQPGMVNANYLRAVEPTRQQPQQQQQAADESADHGAWCPTHQIHCSQCGCDLATVRSMNAAQKRTIFERCEAQARMGTGYGSCDRPLDENGNCDRASDHVEPMRQQPQQHHASVPPAAGINYATHSDSEPVVNTMYAADGSPWWRRQDGRWTDGALSGGWAYVERDNGPMTEEPMRQRPENQHQATDAQHTLDEHDAT